MNGLKLNINKIFESKLIRTIKIKWILFENKQ